MSADHKRSDGAGAAGGPREGGYALVRLANGVFSVRSLGVAETFHPVVGPVAEARSLYVEQLSLRARLAPMKPGEAFVVWDVGLGAAGNVLTVLRAVEDVEAVAQIVSFDRTLEPLRFALQHAEALGYFEGFEPAVRALLDQGRVQFRTGALAVDWQVWTGDFPRQLEGAEIARLPRPHAILFDAFSPAQNPEMWTQPLFARLYRQLDPARPCALPTYSRSTLLRVSLLLAGFLVGRGEATGEKEETTIAANHASLIAQPLDRRWLLRARRSNSAEPLWTPVYRQAPLSEETWDRLLAHPQFR